MRKIIVIAIIPERDSGAVSFPESAFHAEMQVMTDDILSHDALTEIVQPMFSMLQNNLKVVEK